MLLAGCTGLHAPQVESSHIYVLDARAPDKTAQTKRDLVLAVSMPRARPGFDTSRIAYLHQPHELEYFVSNRWADTPARMLEPLLVQTLEQTRSFRAIVRTPGAVPANIRLDTELVRLQQDFGTQPSRVQITLRAQLIDVTDQRVLAVKLFDETENAISDNAYGGVITANRLLQRVLNQLSDFCINESVSQQALQTHTLSK
jgi:cholesterol transport system auxiliary component